MKYYLFAILAFLIGCVETPTSTEPVIDDLSDNGAYILCEGLMGYNNSSLTKFDFKSETIQQDYYSIINNGLKLGDTANDIVLKGDTAFVCVSNSKSIEAFNVKTGKFINRIILKSNAGPRKIKLLNDTVAFCSDLFNSAIIVFNPRDFNIINGGIKVGPQPEGMAICGNYLIVCNSAYGDLNSSHKDAETISIVDINNLQEIKKVKSGANTIEALYNPKNNKLYVAYYNLPSRKDSVGGIIEYSTTDFSEQNRWITNVRNMTFSETYDTLFFINQTTAGNESKGWKGISLIDFNSPKKEIRNIIENIHKDDIWYGLQLYKNQLWIANAKNHLINGEVLIYGNNFPFTRIKNFPTGMNPNKIVFF